MTVQLYKGCWGVTGGGEKRGPIGRNFRTWAATHHRRCHTNTWTANGAWEASGSLGSPDDIIAVFATEAEADAYLAGRPATCEEAMTAPELLARRFHNLYEHMAPQFGYTTREDTRLFIPESPNGKLMIAVCEALAASPEVQALIAEARREAEAMADGLVKASAWVSVAAEVLAGYNRDLGVDLPDTTEIGRIYESRDTPSFRITVGHIRIHAAAIRALKEETHD